MGAVGGEGQDLGNGQRALAQLQRLPVVGARDDGLDAHLAGVGADAVARTSRAHELESSEHRPRDGRFRLLPALQLAPELLAAGR